jgi:hypothetical protein
MSQVEIQNIFKEVKTDNHLKQQLLNAIDTLLKEDQEFKKQLLLVLDGNESKSERKIRFLQLIPRDFIFPVLVLIITCVVAFVLIAWGKEISTKLNKEVFTLLAQLVLISGIGGFVSLAITEFTRAREKRQQERELARKIFSDLVETYNETKRVRRLLRAQARSWDEKSKEYVVDKAEYVTLLQRLNDAQLQFEFYARYTKGNQKIFGINSQKIAANIKLAEKYIGKIISEWEDNLPTFHGDPAAKLLDELTILHKFIDDADKGFEAGVAGPVSNVLIDMAKAINSQV